MENLKSTLTETAKQVPALTVLAVIVWLFLDSQAHCIALIAQLAEGCR